MTQSVKVYTQGKILLGNATATNGLGHIRKLQPERIKHL